MIGVALALAVGASDKVDVRPAADLTVAGVALVGWIVPELLRNQLVPAHCRLCDGADNTGLSGTGSRGSLNGVDAWFHDAMTGWVLSRSTAGVASDAPLGVNETMRTVADFREKRALSHPAALSRHANEANV